MNDVDLTYDGRPPVDPRRRGRRRVVVRVRLVAPRAARRDGGQGRYFLQVHYAAA